MTVAYYLILDHKRRKLLSSSPIMHATQPLQSPQDELAAADVAAQTAPSPLQMMQPTPTTSPASSQPSPVDGAAIVDPMFGMQQRGMEAMQRRWHLGIQSSMLPADMMLEIFRALRTLRASLAHRLPAPPPPPRNGPPSVRLEEWNPLCWLALLTGHGQLLLP